MKVIKGFAQLYVSRLWFRSLQNQRDISVDTSTVKITILIPVLREQSIIINTIKLFGRLKGVERVIFVTTEREYERKSLYPETTIDILEKEKSKYENVEVIHYPFMAGVMSHQLNYACEKLSQEEYKGYVLIYNADSVINQKTINTFHAHIQRNRSAEIIQQSSIFIDNFRKFPQTFSGDFLRGIALYQSRWTYTHEIFRLKKQLLGKDHIFQECGHVVGHGLCISLSTLSNIGYFPTEVPNEDMPLGYFLRLSNKKIYVLPVLEIAESPRTIEAVIKQYTSWFYGVIYYPIYYKIGISKFPRKKFQALVWTMYNTLRAIMWLSNTYLWLILFLLGLYISWGAFLLGIVLLAIYSVGNNHLTYNLLKNTNPTYFETENNWIGTTQLYFASILVYLFQSIPPTMALKNIILSNVFCTSLKKDKTER